MFAAVYLFEVREGEDEKFIESWEALTKLIYKHCNSLGSRLHQEKEGGYIAYAYWPDRETWENSVEKLPKKADKYRQQMFECCSTIETLHELTTVSDLLA